MTILFKPVRATKCADTKNVFFRTAGVPEEKFGGRGGADPVTSLSRVNSAGYKTTTIAQDYYFKDFFGSSCAY